MQDTQNTENIASEVITQLDNISHITQVAQQAQNTGEMDFTGLPLNAIVQYIDSLCDTPITAWTITEKSAYLVLMAEIAVIHGQPGRDALDAALEKRRQAFIEQVYKLHSGALYSGVLDTFGGHETRDEAREIADIVHDVVVWLLEHPDVIDSMMEGRPNRKGRKANLATRIRKFAKEHSRQISRQQWRDFRIVQYWLASIQRYIPMLSGEELAELRAIENGEFYDY